MKHLLHKAWRFLSDPHYRFAILSGLGFYHSLPDEAFLRLKFHHVFGRELDLSNPQTYNEKLQWLKLYDRNPRYSALVDKYAVRSFVSETIGAEYLIPLLGVWDRPEEIDFSALPDQFVLKCTHNSGRGMVICRDKSSLNQRRARKQLKKGLKQNYYLLHREWPYQSVQPRIIGETYLSEDESGSLTDYKIYCFQGKAKMIMVNTGRNEQGGPSADYFDCDYRHLDLRWGYPNAQTVPKKPEKLSGMLLLAERLAERLPEARIDFYCVKGHIYFGEITLFDGAGFCRMEPEEWDRRMGQYIPLP